MEEEKKKDSNAAKKRWIEGGRIDAKGLVKALPETAETLRSGALDVGEVAANLFFLDSTLKRTKKEVGCCHVAEER